MKLSDVKGERSFTILKDAVPYIAKLAKNKYFKKIFDKNGIPENTDEQQEFMLKRITDNVPDLIVNAKDDIAAYLALLEGVPTEDFVKNASGEKVIGGVLEMFTDEYFRTFFIQSFRQSSEKG